MHPTAVTAPLISVARCTKISGQSSVVSGPSTLNYTGQVSVKPQINPPHSLHEVPSLGREEKKGWVPLSPAFPLKIVIWWLTLPVQRLGRLAAQDSRARFARSKR